MYTTTEALGRVTTHDALVYDLMDNVVRFAVNVHERLPHPQREVVMPNCHSMVRAIKIMFGDKVTVVDGYIAGSSHYSIGYDDAIHRINYGGFIEHSWLELRDGAIVDVFPAGVYSSSPLLYPPFGQYHDVFPANVYHGSEGGVPEYLKGEKLNHAWERAARIAEIMMGFPYLVSSLYYAGQIRNISLEGPIIETVARITPLLSVWAEE